MRTAFTHIFFFFLVVVFSGSIDSQNCFSDCIGRLNRSVDTLTAEQMRERLKDPNPVSTNLKILSELKGCGFPGTGMKTTDGKHTNINDFKGKPVFVAFWFTSCAPCIAEITTINKLVKEFGNNAYFLSINTDDVETLKEYLNSHPYNSQHVIISRESATRDFCTIAGFPSCLILNKNGKVTDVWSGGQADPNQQDEFYNRVKKGLEAFK